MTPYRDGSRAKRKKKKTQPTSSSLQTTSCNPFNVSLFTLPPALALDATAAEPNDDLPPVPYEDDPAVGF